MTLPCHEEFSTHPLRPLLAPRWLLISVGLIPWLVLWGYYFNASCESRPGSVGGCRPIIDGAFSTIALILLLAHLWLARRRAHRVCITQRGVGISAGLSQKEVSWEQIREVRYQRFAKVLVIDTIHGAFEIGKELSGFDTLRQRLEENSKYLVKAQ